MIWIFFWFLNIFLFMFRVVFLYSSSACFLFLFFFYITSSILFFYLLLFFLLRSKRATEILEQFLPIGMYSFCLYRDWRIHLLKFWVSSLISIDAGLETEHFAYYLLKMKRISRRLLPLSMVTSFKEVKFKLTLVFLFFII